ncbi:MAG: hypothetical protein AB1394_09310 [Bacteroidota bacterium]
MKKKLGSLIALFLLLNGGQLLAKQYWCFCSGNWNTTNRYECGGGTLYRIYEENCYCSNGYSYTLNNYEASGSC